MKKFAFRLQSILDLREEEEKDILAKLAERESELQRTKTELSDFEENLKKFQNQQKEERTQQNINQLKWSVSYRHKLKLDLLNKARDVQDIVVDINKLRKELIDATQKRKSIEILRDKDKLAWEKEFNRKEQIFLDELAQNQIFLRKNDGEEL